jgi:hypothetical protein
MDHGMTQKVMLYGTPIEVTDGEALGIISFLYGQEFATECAPMGFVMAPEDVDSEWRHGYALGVFGLDAQI